MPKVKQARPATSRIINDRLIQNDLLKFKSKALELGASAAEIIPSSFIKVEERVWYKCLVPRCSGLYDGGSPNCPPNTPKPDFMRKVFSQYQWAVLYKVDIPCLDKYVPSSQADAKARQSVKGKKPRFHAKNWEIIGRLESYIQGQGFYLAMGFSGGTCKSGLCHGLPCAVIKTGTCRFPLQARPSMEAVGIDVFDLANKVGWDSYMIRQTEPDLSQIPCGISVGIVLVC